MVVRFSNLVKFLFETEEGVTAIEYALIASLIAVAIVGALSLVGDEVSNIFDTWTGAVHNAVNGS